MKTIIVLAGNRKEFECYRREFFHPNSMLVYADRPERLYGVRADEIEVYGTFWERPDAGKLRDLAETLLPPP